MADEMIERSEFLEYMQVFEKRLDERFNTTDRRFETLAQSMKVQFEETRGRIRFSFEAVDALRETTDRGFADMRQEHTQQTELLHIAVGHVRRRADGRKAPRNSQR
jgi:hypothetical protein